VQSIEVVACGSVLTATSQAACSTRSCRSVRLDSLVPRLIAPPVAPPDRLAICGRDQEVVVVPVPPAAQAARPMPAIPARKRRDTGGDPARPPASVTAASRRCCGETARSSRSACAARISSIDVVDDLVCARPLLRWDHEINLTATDSIEFVISHARGFDAHAPELVTPRHGRLLVLERADGLPPVQPWVADRNRRLAGSGSSQETRQRQPPLVGPTGVAGTRPRS
jgi:hypothetical protein